jgi:hypothetical protein
MTERHEEQWEPEEAEVQRPVGTVVSVRFPQDVAEQIFSEAERRGVKTSAIVREAVEFWLDADRAPRAATTDFTISGRGGVSVSFYEGRSSHGWTETVASTGPKMPDPEQVTA